MTLKYRDCNTVSEHNKILFLHRPFYLEKTRLFCFRRFPEKKARIIIAIQLLLSVLLFIAVLLHLLLYNRNYLVRCSR